MSHGDLLGFIADYLQDLELTGGGGSGDVVGPAEAIDNAIAVYDGVTGKLLQGSSVTVESGVLTATTLTGGLVKVGPSALARGIFDATNVADADKTYLLPNANGTMALQEWVTTQIDAVIAAAPGALNTLDELAAALGDDASFATTVTTSLAGKASLSGAAFTGQVTLTLNPRVAWTDIASFADNYTLAWETNYQGAIAANRTLTAFSGTPAEGSTIRLKLLVSAVCTLTFPSSKRVGEGDSAITAIQLTPGNHLITFLRVDGETTVSDTIGRLDKLDATTAPTTGDDTADGYSVGSVWIDTTADVSYVCVDATAAAAVWRKTSTNAADTETLTNKSVGAGALTLVENAYVLLDSTLSADGKFTGTVIAGTAGATLAFGDIIYLDPTDSRWELTDANAAAAADGDCRGLVGVCVLAAAADGDPTLILMHGTVRADAAFPTFTVGAPVFVSETAGDATSTAPTTADSVTRVLGWAVDGNTLLVQPAGLWTTHV